MRTRWNHVAAALFTLQSSLLLAGDVGTVYSIQRVGLSTPEFFNSAGQQFSFGPNRVADQLTGSSDQFFGAGNRVGEVPYVHNVSTGISTPIGLMDAAHTGPGGRRYGWTGASNALGYMVGNSLNYSQAGPLAGEHGNSAWAHDLATGLTARIGFYDTEHTASSGFQRSESQQIGPSSWAAGYSEKYSGDLLRGQTAWAYNIATGSIREVGLSGTEFMGASGGPYSRPLTFARNGLLIGETDRFVGSDPFFNAAAWIHNPGDSTTRRVGLTDADHTALDGSQFSRVERDFTGPDSGLLFGSSARRNGYGLAFTAWTYNPNNDALRVYDGLTGSPFVSSTGVSSSSIADITQSGFVTGQTRRFGPGDALAGQTPWLHNPSTNQTAPIGLIGPDYTNPITGMQEGWLTGITEAGQVAGQAVYKPGEAHGYRAWSYSPSTNQTQQIGLHFNDALVDPGRVRNEPLRMDQSGFVVGRGRRFVGGAEAGQAGWLFDPASNSTTALVVSTRADGFASSEAFDVNAQGLVTGVYTRYSGMASQGEFAFYWSAQDGFIDVGSLVAGGLAANGWERLLRAQLPGADGTITGFGIRLDGSHMPFVLQAVPEPTTALGLAFSGLLAARRSRRQCIRS